MFKRVTTDSRAAILATTLLLGPATGLVSAAQWQLPDNAPLLTRWSREVAPNNALPEYPRPQMVRKR